MAASASPCTVADRLGHAEVAVALGVYAAGRPGWDRAWAELLRKNLGASVTQTKKSPRDGGYRPGERPTPVTEVSTTRQGAVTRSVVAILACATLLLTGAAGSLSDVAGAQPKPSIQFVGDSTQAETMPAIAADLAPGSYSFYGHPSLTIGDAVPFMRSHHPKDWVIELGTNDAVPGYPTWTSEFDAEVNAVQHAHCVILVTVSLVAGSEGGDRSNGVAKALNDAMYAEARKNHVFHVVDYSHLYTHYKLWVSQLDAIHPTETGQAELAQMETEALWNDCG